VRLTILVGVPGSGKSTWARAQDTPVVSSDAIRGKRGYSAADNARVFREFHERIDRHLAAGEDVIADATNLTRQAREKLRLIAVGWHAETCCVLFGDTGAALERNRRRGRDQRVPTDQMKKMCRLYRDAKREVRREGYGEVVTDPA
jgi:predicted kinase